jgi:hypothetical protein
MDHQIFIVYIGAYIIRWIQNLCTKKRTSQNRKNMDKSSVRPLVQLMTYDKTLNLISEINFHNINMVSKLEAA